MLQVLFILLHLRKILTADGVGEATTTVSIGNKNSIEIKKEINFTFSWTYIFFPLHTI